MARYVEKKTTEAAVCKYAAEYYTTALEKLENQKLAIPTWKEMCALGRLNRSHADALALSSDRVKAWKERIDDLNEIMTGKAMSIGKMPAAVGVFFMKALHGYRDKDDEAGSIENKAGIINAHITNIGFMLQNPSPTRINPFEQDAAKHATGRAALTTGDKGGGNG